MSKTYTVLGLMSGTSLDGVDVAIIYTDGHRIHDLDVWGTRAFTQAEKAELNDYTDRVRRWDFDGPPPNALAEAEMLIDRLHVSAVEEVLTAEGIRHLVKPDLIGYHGQTLLHDATRQKTLQIGSGQHLADHFDVPTVYDFRSEDVAKGGQGAPLAPIYHRALVEFSGLDGVSAVLNLGGVGNVTIIDGERLIASDTGPANGPLDSFLAERGLEWDDRGSVSEAGVIDFNRVGQWLERDFFKRSWPRSADRHDFDVWDELKTCSTEDGAATLCAFTAQAVAQTLGKMGVTPDRMIVCGGGRHNRTIMTMLGLETGIAVYPAERFDWDSDAIEAQAFGYLAARVVEGLPNSFPTTTGVSEPVVGGRVAYPR